MQLKWAHDNDPLNQSLDPSSTKPGRFIIEKENLSVSPEGQDYLWKISNGSLRILINYLEKILEGWRNQGRAT